MDSPPSGIEPGLAGLDSRLQQLDLTNEPVQYRSGNHAT